MPQQSCAGVWESPSLAYLSSILVTRCGVASGLAIVLAEMLAELLRKGYVNFLARITVSDLDQLPLGEVVDIPPSAAVTVDGKVVTVCGNLVL